MTELRKRMLEDLRLAGYSAKTQEMYVGSVEAFAKFHKKSPALCGREEVRRWILHLQNRGLAASSIHVRFSGLLFLYRRTLNRPEVMADLPLPRVRRKAPIILSAAEVYALLEALGCPFPIALARFRAPLRACST